VTPLLFLHGVGGGHAAWDRQVEHFGRRGYQCIAWDQPGYGETPSVEPYTLQTVTDALKRHIGRDRVVLVGQSMGGFVAQEMYARSPDRIAALVLGFTSPAFGGAGSQFARRFIAARIGPLDEGKTMAQIAEALMPTLRGTKSDPQGLAHAERVMSAIPPATYRKAVQMLTTFDRRDQLEKIAVPALLVAGSDDKIASPSVMEFMARRIPHAEFVLLDGCGHLGPMDQPQAFNNALESFLQHHSL
jgi:pimeloyl-ACP methyl ester carboxylesterase